MLNGMTATIIDGKKLAQHKLHKISMQVQAFKKKYHTSPGLAVVLVGKNPASNVYVRNKERTANACGMRSFSHKFDANISEAAIVDLIVELNADDSVDGILVQLPLPAHIAPARIINTINPAKDVDGFHVNNTGKLSAQIAGLVPCTPLGCLELIQSVACDIAGLHAVVIGRSNIVGRPMAQLLLNASATVTIVHSRTIDIQKHCQQGDIIVAAVGIAHFVKADWLKPGVIVIDVGINTVEDEHGSHLVGDVDYPAAKQVAGAITPVPGGVGPMTIATLLANTLAAANAHKDAQQAAL